ncbi:MAG: low molecular weight protein arginine phosphatase [Firmicutes bacterium]|nr:low molecular weight protein arginine phosphatase [Bacillota bacterium]
MKILFVCTGNTCRSSMAQALLEHLAKEQGLTQLEVRSAGLAADPGAKAAVHAEKALQELDIDLSHHRAQNINADLVAWADLILTMTRRHKEAVLRSFPEAEAKVYVLKEFLISEADNEAREQKLFELHQAMAAKREAFAAEVHPNISELRARRAMLLQELADVEQLLAERQAELWERTRVEREEIDRLERSANAIDVLDPFGQPLAVYRQTRDELKSVLMRLIEQVRTGSEK